MAGHNLSDEKVRTADVVLDSSLLFERMPLSDPVKQALARNNFIHPSPIQARAIPLARCDFDLLVQAKAGTGKTLVFAITIVESHDPEVGFPQSLTIVPTREIAVQVESVLNRIGAEVANFKARSFIGGMEISVDRKNLQNCSAVVGTPGRIRHLIKSNVLNTSYIRTLVMDEADTLLDASMRGDINKIVAALPDKRQTIVCSATFYNDRDRELLRYLNEKFIGVTPKREVPLLFGIKQFVRELPDEPDNIKDLLAKVGVLNEIFRQITFTQCVVFANTTAKAETYCTYLKKAGWPTEVINGAMEQRLRLKAIDDFRSFRSRVLIATNLIARGIDVENVNLVINADVPKDNATYLHRIGRAGRFGTRGIAITLVSGVKDMERFRRILHDIGGNEMFVLKFPRGPLEDIWQFESYGDRFEKLFASRMEQEIRDRDADQLFLKAMKMLDDTAQAVAGEPKQANGDQSGVGGGGEGVKLDDSLEKSTSDEETVVEVGMEENPNGCVTNGGAEVNGNGTSMDGLSVSMEKLSLDRGQPTNGGKARLDSLNGNRKKRPEHDSNDEDDDIGSEETDDDDDSSAPKPGPSGKIASGLKQKSSDLDEMLLMVASAGGDRGGLSTPVPDPGIPGECITIGTTPNGTAIVRATRVETESDLESSSSLSTNVTEKVEVGSDFNASMSRLNQIPDPRFRQVGSVDCSDLEHSSSSSDSESNGGADCPPFEANNDALFAKIMEQKELSVEQQEHAVQLHSIDGCSLEVHDDTISDRGLSRKGTVPDVVPCGISLDPSRLHGGNRSILGGEIGLRGGGGNGGGGNGGSVGGGGGQDDGEGEEIELNSNTCGSNRGSIFEEEEEVEDVIQANIPKRRIRFQQQDSLEVNSNTVGSNVGSTPEPPEMLDQLDQQLPIIAIAADPIIVDRAHHHDDMMEDASSYSSYDSDGSNSSFFDDVDRVSVTSAKSTPKETLDGGGNDVLMAGAVGGSLEQIVVNSNSVSVAASPHLFVPSVPTPPLIISSSIGLAGAAGILGPSTSTMATTVAPVAIPLPPAVSIVQPPILLPPTVAPEEAETIRSPTNTFARLENLRPTAGGSTSHYHHYPHAAPSRHRPATDGQATALYHRVYSLWSNQYWNQLTQINDYVRFSSYARRNTYRSP
ncbi:AGAP005391-PA-like protein [Anopheles sinensis]|uniref:RNA helicase n=1 Tax=Anopheles sinensis TaxID=74873 RepID=A0A084W9V8_ANOSI|nr:AGAP005391-PA-like protein [Anopheles sinensis]